MNVEIFIKCDSMQFDMNNNIYLKRSLNYNAHTYKPVYIEDIYVKNIMIFFTFYR